MRLLLIFISTILYFGCASSSTQNKLISVETVEAIKKTTVPIVCGAPTKDGMSFNITQTIGSAFFVNAGGDFLTAGHVLDDWNKIDRSKGDCFPALYIPRDGWQALTGIRWIRFTDCFRSADNDIALCKSPSNPFTMEDLKGKIDITRFSSAPIKDGIPVAFTGFPLNSWRPITSIGHVASTDEASNLIIVDKNAWPGASGCPVYLADGTVIGVLIQRGISDGAGLAYVRSTRSILKFLLEHGTPYQEKTD